jgi:regulatory protein
MVEREITGIKAQKKNPERVSVYLDGEYAFGLSRITAAWLQIGQRLSEEKINSLCEQDESEVAYQRALILLNHQQRTSHEIRQKLIEKGFSSTRVEEVVDRLTQAGLVEDGQYALLWVENRNTYHPRSRRLIRMELRQKGVAEDQIDQALLGSAEDDELATQAAMQQIRKYSDLDWPEFRKKMSAFLLRRGFSYGTVAPVVRSIWESEIAGQISDEK